MGQNRTESCMAMVITVTLQILLESHGEKKILGTSVGMKTNVTGMV